MGPVLRDVKAAQPEWFSRKNKRFFGDVNYRVLYGKVSGERFLVRSTYAWSDMFGAPKRLHYRINRLDDNLKIRLLVDDAFRSIGDVKDWLKVN